MLCAEDRFAADDSIPLAAESVELMRLLASSEPAELVQLHPEPKALKQVARCLRWHIRYRSERELRSAEFLEMLRIGAASVHGAGNGV